VEFKGEDLWCYLNKIQSVYKNVSMIINSPTNLNKTYLIYIPVANISGSFTHKMAAKTSWHRYVTKLRHCHPMYSLIFVCITKYRVNELFISLQLSFYGLRLPVREANHNNFCSCFIKHDFWHLQTALEASEAQRWPSLLWKCWKT